MRPFRSGRGGGQRVDDSSARKPCFNLLNNGHCRFGTKCRFSHDLASAGKTNIRGAARAREATAKESEVQQQVRADYNTWKRFIKVQPRASDTTTMQQMWEGGLEILNADDRDWKQQLPRDLDEDKYNGRAHIQALMEKTDSDGSFIHASRAFLLVMTHAALLDCLSVDTCVGGLYNFIGGTNGTRALPFFQQLCEALGHAHIDKFALAPLASIETTLIALSTALRELLRREQRVRFNDDLPALIHSIENTAEIVGKESESMAFQIVSAHVTELRAMVQHAGGLLAHEDLHPSSGPAVASSSYPRDIVVPCDRHDNDKADMTKIQLFPTRDEILSDAIDFLPSTDRDQPHFLTNQVARHLDTQFRLLRHDIFGEIKQAISNLMTAIQNNPAALQIPQFALGDMRASCYPDACISHVIFGKRRGLEVHITFSQPEVARKKSEKDRAAWWEDSKRLDRGSLLSFITGNGTDMQHLFFTVLDRDIDCLYKNPEQATIIAKLVTNDQSGLESMIISHCQRAMGILIEFPGVLPATFVPILETLQGMQQLGRLPFRQWILPDKTDGVAQTTLEIPPPVYARKRGFSFPLDSISIDGAESLSINAASSPQDEVLVDKVESSTTLDRGQCRALIAALTREFAFIQGPPGTGKSYLGVQMMRVLMSIKKTANLGPVVVVCYTNHALDQFLEHLHAVGITKIIRMGRQSKSVLVQDHLLHVVAKKETKTKSERWQLAMAFRSLEDDEMHIQHTLNQLRNLYMHKRWQDYERHLATRYPKIHRQFNQIDEEGFELVGRHPFEIWVSGEAGIERPMTPSMDRIIQQANHSVHSLTFHEKRDLVDYWTQEIYATMADEIYELVHHAEQTEKEKQNIHDETDRRVLQGADVIGITTTGLATRISTLQRLRCKVVICEEAGEVMEPHMISALLPTVEHFIQIGDHEQLRPSTNDFSLSLESKNGALYQLDRSQFERLSVGEPGRPRIPVAQLDIQRRMRPEISTLIRETIYPKLKDHNSTGLLPDVVGMRNNVFWLNHNNSEAGKGSEGHLNKSKSNPWEVKMVHALVRHIVRQGAYKSSEIAVLTPYTGQLQKLRAAMRSDFEIVLSERDEDALAKDGLLSEDQRVTDAEVEAVGNDNRRKPLEKKRLSELLRVATVDNFQGEEAKIVIISLVRSNAKQTVGFLKTTNRINVLLSRAKHGMFLIGNTDTYSNVPMWQKVIGMLGAAGSVGDFFDLRCPRHPDTEIRVAQPDDFFRYSPEGGCMLACDRRLPDCGHKCESRCHSESMHTVFPCPKPCERLHHPCNHPCQKPTCGEDCGPCLVIVNNVTLECGHLKDNVTCFKTQALEKIMCTTIMPKKVPKCGHDVNTQCFIDVSSEFFWCKTPCAEILPCSHTCPGNCARCNSTDTDGQSGMKHQPCKKICGRKYGTCNHTCPRLCHDGTDCGSCLAPCEVRCAHSRCTMKCYEPCAPCIEPCTWSCEHKTGCTLPCSAPCNRLPCNERCAKTLPCGHRCPGICGEECPVQYCQDCGTHRDDVVDMLMFETFANVDVNETPIVVLGCGHAFTAETLDGMVGMKEVYEADGEGHFTDLRDISGLMAVEIPKCPNCRHPIRQFATQRFNRVINRAVIDVMSKQFLVSGQTELRDLEQRLSLLEEDLESSRQTLLILTDLRNANSLRDGTNPGNAPVLPLRNRYNKTNKLGNDLKLFRKKFADMHQPAQKLEEATLYALKKRTSLEKAFAELDLGKKTTPRKRDRQIILGSFQVQNRLYAVLLEDMFIIIKHLKPATNVTFPQGSPIDLAKRFFKGCEESIRTCIKQKLPKLAVEATLYYARIARGFQGSGILNPAEQNDAVIYRETAKGLLENAKELCTQPFQNAKELLVAVEDSTKLLRKEWYEEVTPEELAEIKKAMVSGQGGIATHSGHWYNCENGHPFAIGECGMPMELARCPECGAQVGGQNHTEVQGVTRATNME